MVEIQQFLLKNRKNAVNSQAINKIVLVALNFS